MGNGILNEIMKMNRKYTGRAHGVRTPRINTLAVEIKKVIIKFVFAP